jgi:DNA polymerase-3 subunit alpha
MGLEVLPPSINKSAVHFTVEDGNIRFGLGAIKGAGVGAIEKIIEAREEEGPFETIFDLTEHVDLQTVNKRTIEALAQAGALDDLEGHRAQLVEVAGDAVSHGQQVQANKAAGQNSLFGDGSGEPAAAMTPNLPMVDPWPKAKLLKHEREVVGFYVSGHPLEQYRAEAEEFASARFGNVEALEQAIEASQSNEQQNGRRGRNRGPVRTFCGILTEVNRHTTKSGKPIAFATIEDFTGQGELVVFANILDRVQHYLEVDEVVLVKGNVEVRGGTVKVIVKEVMPMWKVRDQMVQAIELDIDAGAVQPKQIREFRQLCDQNQGHCKLYFNISAPETNFPQRVRSRQVVVDPTPELMRGMKRLFGSENVALKGED